VNTSYDLMRRGKAMSQGAAKSYVLLGQICSLLRCFFRIRVVYVYNLGVASHGGKMKQACSNNPHHDA
jgi:hypothetical protein